MGTVIFIFGAMCAIQEAHSSLPSLAEIKLRSRWCLGEGAHCPVNLPFKISPCCKPFVCTAIPKTHKPSLIMRFKDYKDHRCILPATDLQSGSLNSSVLEYDNFNPTESQFQNHESITSEVISVVDENVGASTVTLDENETNPNTSLDNLSGYEEDGSSLASNETYSDENERNSSHIVKRSISIYSSENNQSWSSGSSYSSSEYKDHNGNNSLESEMSSLENNNLTLSSDGDSKLKSEVSKETDSSYNYGDNATALHTNSSSSSSELFSYSIQNNTTLNNNSMIADNHYKNNTSLITTEITNSSEEDWTSSQMDYDTRPGLHKIVTVHPFRLFQSVELIRLNESIETSD